MLTARVGSLLGQGKDMSLTSNARGFFKSMFLEVLYLFPKEQGSLGKVSGKVCVRAYGGWKCLGLKVCEQL